MRFAGIQSSKMQLRPGARGSAPNPLEELTALPQIIQLV